MKDLFHSGYYKISATRLIPFQNRGFLESTCRIQTSFKTQILTPWIIEIKNIKERYLFKVREGGDTGTVNYTHQKFYKHDSLIYRLYTTRTFPEF